LLFNCPNRQQQRPAEFFANGVFAATIRIRFFFI